MPCSEYHENKAKEAMHRKSRIDRGLQSTCPNLPWEIVIEGRTIAAFADEFAANHYVAAIDESPLIQVIKCP